MVGGIGGSTSWFGSEGVGEEAGGEGGRPATISTVIPLIRLG